MKAQRRTSKEGFTFFDITYCQRVNMLSLMLAMLSSLSSRSFSAKQGLIKRLIKRSSMYPKFRTTTVVAKDNTFLVNEALFGVLLRLYLIELVLKAVESRTAKEMGETCEFVMLDGASRVWPTLAQEFARSAPPWTRPVAPPSWWPLRWTYVQHT